MALDDNGRKELYRKLLNDPATSAGTKKYSFTQWEQKIAESPNALAKIGAYAISKKWANDLEDFSNRYGAGAKPYTPPSAPKPQAAPVAPPPVEEEPYVPEPQPLVGSPEYDAQLQAQYGGMAPTLGTTFGGVPAAFETKAQKKQEQISPAFKAQQLAFEDVPIAEEQRRAQRQFAKATKERQQAALMGGPGFEVEQEKKAKERGYVEGAIDQIGAFAEGGKRIAKNILSTAGYYAQMQAATDPMASLPYEKRQEMMQQAGQTMYNNATAAQNTFQNEIAKRNIQTSVLQAIEKGQYNRIPESVLYTIGDAAMQIIPSILTFGGSTYMQTLPQAYKDGVEAIAKEKGISPEQVIASGDDGMIVSQLNSGTQSMLEFAGAGLVSKGIASKGGYKAMRDWLLSQNVNRRLAQGAALLGVGTGEAATEYGQELTGQIGKAAAASSTTKAFLDKLPKELFTPEAKKQRQEAFVGGMVGGLGLAGGGQAIQSAMDRTLFESPKIGKATQRADYDVVQTDNKITERNKIAQAMEEAVKANPEAEGQIRQQYQKRISEAAPKDEEVLSAYESLSVLPETEEKNAIRENLEGYMAEKGIQAEPTGMDAGLGELMRREPPIVQTVNPDFPPPVTEEEVTEELTPLEEDEDLAAFGRELEAIEQAAPVAPAEEEVVTEEVPSEPVAPEAAPETQKAEIEKKSKDLEKRYNALQKRHKKELNDLNKKEGKNYEDTFDILNINEYSRDKTPRSKEAIELANRHEKEFQELLQEQRSLQDMAGEISYSSYDFSSKKPILQKLKDAIGAIYRKDKNALEEGFMNSYEALDRANQVGGGNYVAHGMGKASIPQAYNALVELFTKGINPQRGGGRLYVAPLSGGISTGQTASGNAYMDGPFTLVANREHQGDITDINQVGGIIVNDGIATDDVISSLRDLFPNLIIESTSNTDKLVEQLNQKAEQQAAPEVVAAAPVEEVAPEAPIATTTDSKGRVSRFFKKEETKSDGTKVTTFQFERSDKGGERFTAVTGVPVNEVIGDQWQINENDIPPGEKPTKIVELREANDGRVAATVVFENEEGLTSQGEVTLTPKPKPKAPAAPAPKGRKKKEAPVTPAPAAPKKEEGEVQQEPRAAQKIAAISPTNLQVFKGVVTKDPLKPKMQGVYFDKANQKIVATDGMNMVVIDRDVKSDVIIDPKTGEVIKEPFPDYQTVIPTDYTKVVRNVSINDLLGKLDAIIKGDKERTEKAIASITFDEEQVGITPKVLKAGLKALKDLGYETASIEYKAPNKPLLIKTKDGKTLLLTMPAFLGEDGAEGAISIGEFALEDTKKPKAEVAQVLKKEEYDFSKVFEPLTEEEQKKIDKENLQEEVEEKQRLFDKAGFDKSWAKNYDEAKTKLIDQYNKAKEKKEKAEAKVIKKSGGKSVFVGDEVGGAYVSVDRINEKNRLQDIAIAEKDMAEAVKDLAKLGVKLPSQIKEESVTAAPAAETKEGKKAEAKEEKPTAVVSEKDVVSTKIKEIAEKFKSIESELQGEIDVQDFSDRLRKRYEEIKSQYGEAKANEVLKSESNRADKIIKESRDGILKRLKEEYFKKNGFAPSSIKEFQKGIDSGEYKIDDLPSYKDAVSAKIVEETKPPTPSFTSQQSSEAATAFDKAKTSKGFDKKYGKGAYKALSDITKNFEDIMDKVSEKIKQDCIV